MTPSPVKSVDLEALAREAATQALKYRHDTKQQVADAIALVFQPLIAEVRQLRKWVNDLQSHMFVNCVYCGHRYGPDPGTPTSMAEVLKAHIQQCPKHPLSAAEAENAALRAEFDALLTKGYALRSRLEVGERQLYSSSMGPCAVHAEIKQGCMNCVITRLHAAEQRLEVGEKLAEALRHAADTFRRYATMHANKLTLEGRVKAEANLEMAERMERALAAWEDATAKEALDDENLRTRNREDATESKPGKPGETTATNPGPVVELPTPTCHGWGHVGPSCQHFIRAYLPAPPASKPEDGE